jgi:predicted SprT family Zn-dependent metalloprotease
MDTTTATKMVVDLFEEFGLMEIGNKWQFRWDNSKSRFGCCRHQYRQISLSKPLTLLNTEAEVSDVIRHEIAHALAGANAGHGAAWKRQCMITGARPSRCYSEKVVTPQARWRVECPSCGLSGQRHRKPRARSFHPPCGVDLIWTLQAS